MVYHLTCIPQAFLRPKNFHDPPKTMITVCNSARAVASFVIALEGFREVTNLRLQKLLYFLQGYSFQRFHLPLFPENLEAWTYGPVCASLYGDYVAYRNRPIPHWEGARSLPTNPDSNISMDNAQNFVRVVMEWADHYTSGQLVEMSHQAGTPWAIVWNNGEGKYAGIPMQLIQRYFTHE